MICFTVAEYMYVIWNMDVKLTNMQQVGANCMTDEEKY